jgi:chorismate mutase/prephenate dehydratase
VSSDLERLRESVDRLDDEILKALNERAKLARAIGTLKVGQAYRPEREAQVLTRLKAANPGPLSDETVALLFREIMSACLALERPISVAYLGPKGTFSEAAAMKHFGLAADALATPSIDEVFREVEARAADFGIVPVENSTEGAVGRSLDLMPQTPMKVCGEVLLRIHHHVMARPEVTELGAIHRLFPQPVVAQCHGGWCNSEAEHRRGKQCRSRAARRRNRKRRRGRRDGGRALWPHDPRGNVRMSPTSDALSHLGDYEPRLGARQDLARLAAKTRRAVYEMLTPFATRGVSMTKFESRPSKVALWEYFFFIDDIGG